MSEFIGSMGDTKRAIWRVTPDSFFVPGDRSKILVLRKLDDALFAKIQQLNPSEILYLIDDDIRAGSIDKNIPRAYRARLARMAAGPLVKMLSMVNRLYVA